MSNYLDKTQSIVMRVVTTPMKMRMVFFSACYTLLVAIPMIYAPLAHSAIPICSASEKMISYTAGSNGSVVVTSATPGVVANNYFSCHTGGSVSISANPDAGYTFDHWDVLYGTPGAIPSAPVWSIPGNVDNIGVVARFKKSGAAPNIIEPNIYFIVDDSKYMNSETLYNDGSGLNDSSLSYYNMFLNYHNDPGYDLGSSTKIGGGKLEKCSGYNRTAFNPSNTYKPWDGFANRFMRKSCDTTMTNAEDEAICVKWHPEQLSTLAGSGCSGSGCTSALSSSVQHVVPKGCSSGGCASIINLHPTTPYSEPQIATDKPGGECFYPKYEAGKCESFKYFECKPWVLTLPDGVCATVTWEGGVGSGWWNPHVYTCWSSMTDVTHQSCGVDHSLMCFEESDFKDAAGNWVYTNTTDAAGNPTYSYAVCLADISAKCSALGGSVTAKVGGMSPFPQYANCGLVGWTPTTQLYPNTVRDIHRNNFAYTPWVDANADGQYNAGECGSSGQDIISYGGTDHLAFATNYANWFTYNRTRLQLEKGALIRTINEMQLGRVAIYTISGKKVIDLTPISTGRADIINVIKSISVDYTTTFSAANNLVSAHKAAIEYFQEDATRPEAVKRQYTDIGGSRDSSADCRQNHIVIITGSDDDSVLTSSLISQAASAASTDLCPSLANKVKATSLNRNSTNMPQHQHVKTSIVSINSDGSVIRVDSTAPNVAPAGGELAKASWDSFGLYQRVFKMGDIDGVTLPNLGQGLGDTLSRYLSEITSEDQNVAPSQCGSPGKRIAWRELTPR